MLGINWFTAGVLYVLIWWVVLFAMLPIGTNVVADADPATGWRGTPEKPRMGRKVLWTTIAATLIWGVFIVVQSTGWISFRSGWLSLPNE
jgi:predicted secreted protein